MKWNHNMKRLLFFLILVGILGAGFYLYYKEGTLPVNSKEPKTKIFVIEKGESLSSIAKKLSSEELIRNKIVFYLVVKQKGIDKNIQAGDFRLSTTMNVYEIADNLTRGTLDVWVTIIEGLRKEEIAQIISKNLGIPEVEFLKYGKEGYLFPDTYLIPREATAESVVQMLENNFENKFDSILRQKAKTKGLSSNGAIILASLVEREARLGEDRPLVASVILNRLNAGMKLDIDATVQYALGYQPEEKTWWKKNLTQEDLKIDSPYNTYTNAGLPPGPISNPGLASIKAVVDAPETDYLFYVSDSNGKLHFAKNIEGHNENIRKYLK